MEGTLNMEKKKLQAKDLITVGIFTALYFVLLFLCGMLGYVPIFYTLLPALAPVVCGIPFMLFLTKVKCFGMVSIMGTICGGLMVLTGHTFVPIITGVVFGLLADLIFMAGKYKSVKASVAGYAVFSLWILGMLMPFWIMKDSFEKMMLESMGADYTRTVFELFRQISWAFPIMAFVGGILGAFVGFAMLRKHFKRAAIA
ncbi:MAG: MptD family putative ECF transporter S component [Bacillota bacterium]